MEKIKIELGKNEAFVLFEYLATAIGNVAENSAERAVLDGVFCELEKALPEPFDPNYPEILKTARENIENA